MQTQGSLAQNSLASLLEAMQSERATGTLSVASGDASCSLYFLFGHLFHAAGDLGQGEEAVISALSWKDGQFTFDPRAKLPAEETIKSATTELLAEAERRQPVGAPSNGSGRSLEVQAVGSAEARSTGAATAVAEPAAPTAGSTTTSWGSAPPTITTGETMVTETAIPTIGVAPPGTPPETAPVYGNPNAVPLGELYPLPAGKPIYEGLKSAFVDFPKLLRTLDTDKLTGYVRLEGPGFSGVLLLHDGHVLESLFSDGTLTQAETAFQSLRRRMERGEGLLDVIELSGETVVALAQLLTARPLFTGLLGRFVNFEQLLEYLSEEKVDGSVVVAGGTETGVILLRKGSLHGAYTHSQRDLQESPVAVNRLAAERPARIEVKAGAGSPPGIDVEAALRKPL
ncbi:MAG TPA: DUF4388 domain-containing protein [Candidatus Dormibacteraeota bacterium]|nr:DUF4388 domain-containing protein [Candidatus Dormibacteraeota bacterium]